MTGSGQGSTRRPGRSSSDQRPGSSGHGAALGSSCTSICLTSVVAERCDRPDAEPGGSRATYRFPRSVRSGAAVVGITPWRVRKILTEGAGPRSRHRETLTADRHASAQQLEGRAVERPSRVGVRVPQRPPPALGREGEGDGNGTKTGDTATGQPGRARRTGSTGRRGTHNTHPPTQGRETGATGEEQRRRTYGEGAKGGEGGTQAPTFAHVAVKGLGGGSGGYPVSLASRRQCWTRLCRVSPALHGFSSPIDGTRAATGQQFITWRR
jgi:hypothetical protein